MGIVAQGLLPGGKLIPYDGLSLDGQLKLTQTEIAAGAEVLYEPAFQFDQIFIKADILRKVGNACVLAYNASFEKTVLGQLADQFPEHRAKLETIMNNLRDLATPFRARDCYHWEMKGSYSQKVVLPALVPGMGYEGLEIRDGGMAMEGYFRMIRCREPGEVDKIRQELLEYCRMDTLGMVRLYEKLREMGG